jgi:A/G-specific adenine glycosylase
MHPITQGVLSWYSQHARDLPWRKTKDPYKIWLSEIILQQTRVSQGLPYYQKFIEHFPTVQHLASAVQEEVLLLWQGLGYYSRARNLHACAQKVVTDFDGDFPASYKELLSLPGIGPYTAAAIASFAFDLPYPAVDGNLIRVFSRLFGVYHVPNSPASQKEVQRIASELMEGAPPATFNQAMMEMGAMMCTPKKPQCELCPVYEHCYAKANNVVNQLPVPKAKIKIRDRYFYYVIVYSQGKYAIEQRKGKDIWENLFQFPLIEVTHVLEDGEVEKEVNKRFPKSLVQKTSPEYTHILSHQRLHTRFVEVELKNKTDAPESYLWVGKEDFKKYAFPRLIERYLEDTNSAAKQSNTYAQLLRG